MTDEVRRIVVGVDGSDNGRRAVGWAVLLAERLGAEVTAVHAVGLLAHLGPGPAVASHSHMDQLRAAFESEWCAPLAEARTRHRLLMVEGPPAPVLLGVAADEQADLIIVGSRGTGGFAELMLGSTSHQVVEHAHRAVLVVPPER